MGGRPMRRLSLYEHLNAGASERKLRLLFCAIIRQVWPEQPPLVRAAVEQCEATADHPPVAGVFQRLQQGARALLVQHTGIERREADPVLELVRLLTLNNLTFRNIEQFGRIFFALPFSHRLSQDPVLDIFGRQDAPVAAEPAWRTSNVTALAQAIYDDRAYDRLPILADALEDAGCTNAAVLNHCRLAGEHVRGCWVVDLLLGKV